MYALQRLLYCIAQFLMGEILTDTLHQEIDGQHLRPPVLAILLEIIEICQIHQYFPQKIVLYDILIS